jgi:glycosyltransferase involved in cell wall biosynthesis
MTVTLSIVVPAYNVAPFVEHCIESILAQLQPHHELIFIDDGSSDNTLALVRALQDGHPGANFHIVCQPNQGISAARNSGILAAKGDYIAFVDSDDELLAGALAALEGVITQHHPDVIACEFTMWYPDRPVKNRRIRLGYPAGVMLDDRSTILTTFFADRRMYVWANVFRREIYAQLAAPIFPPNRMFEDVSTVPRLLSQCNSLYYLAQEIIGYRQHPSSITKSISEQWCFDFAAALSLAKQHLHQREVCASAKLHFDVAASHFYIGVVKYSYQLPAKQGRNVRNKIKPIFLQSLFHDTPSVLNSMAGTAIRSNDRRHDARIASQVRGALNGSVAFHVKQTVSRKIKRWRRLLLAAKTR